MSNYKRNYPKEKEQNKILSNPDILFGLTHKDSFNINVENPHSRLTGDRANSLIKNKNTIIHSNSTNHIRPENLMSSIEFAPLSNITGRILFIFKISSELSPLFSILSKSAI